MGARAQYEMLWKKLLESSHINYSYNYLTLLFITYVKLERIFNFLVWNMTQSCVESSLRRLLDYQVSKRLWKVHFDWTKFSTKFGANATFSQSQHMLFRTSGQQLALVINKSTWKKNVLAAILSLFGVINGSDSKWQPIFDRSNKITPEFLDIPCEMTTKWLLCPIFAWHMVYTISVQWKATISHIKEMCYYQVGMHIYTLGWLVAPWTGCCQYWHQGHVRRALTLYMTLSQRDGYTARGSCLWRYGNHLCLLIIQFKHIPFKPRSSQLKPFFKCLISLTFIWCWTETKVSYFMYRPRSSDPQAELPSVFCTQTTEYCICNHFTF